MPFTILRTAALSLGLLMSYQAATAQNYYHRENDVRWPVDETIRHLRDIEEHSPFNNRKQLERYDNAVTHLSQFMEKMHYGKFDSGKLERGIDDVQSVLNKNPLDGRGRGILNRDVLELQRLRANYRFGYRYSY